MTPLVSIVVPVYNEETNIEPFYAEVTRVLDRLEGLRWELIFVDDGSVDRTIERVSKLRATDPRVCALRFSRNFGSYAALTAGLHYARGDAAVAISVDMQDPPDLIAALVREWQAGYPIVWGVRESRADPFLKTLLARAFYGLLRRYAFPSFPAGGMDCGLFDRRVVDIVRALPERNGILFITIYAMGFPQKQIPYARQARTRGESKWPFWKRMKAAVDVLVMFTHVPVRVATAAGLLLLGASVIGGGVAGAQALVAGARIPGWLWATVTLGFAQGVQLVMLGLLGEYVWRIADQVNARPRYIVMDELGFAELPPPPPLSLQHLSVGPSYRSRESGLSEQSGEAHGDSFLR